MVPLDLTTQTTSVIPASPASLSVLRQLRQSPLISPRPDPPLCRTLSLQHKRSGFVTGETSRGQWLYSLNFGCQKCRKISLMSENFRPKRITILGRKTSIWKKKLKTKLKFWAPTVQKFAGLVWIGLVRKSRNSVISCPPTIFLSARESVTVCCKKPAIQSSY